MSLKTKQCKHGKFTYYDNDRYIGKQLDVLGYYSENEVQTLLGLITPDSVVIDVGANIGAITVPLAKKAKKVYAYEPQPNICELLCLNVMQNNLGNVIARTAAVGGRLGKAEVPRYDLEAADMNTGAVSVKRIPPRAKIPEETVVVPIYKLSPGFWSSVDLIKVDAEGWESEVIFGATEVIRRDRPILYVENNEPGAAVSCALIRQIMDLGYSLSWHLPVLECLTNATHRTLTLSSNMLCVPPSRPVTVGGPDFWPINNPGDNWRDIPVYAAAIAACEG